jgi:beta-galactosidase/beta-glucuronidase
MSWQRWVCGGILAATMASFSEAQPPAWKPAVGPLKTRWASLASSDAPHPEYPRPQLVRRKWLNLNGLWQWAEAGPRDPVPVGQALGERVLVPFPIESALSGVMRSAERMWYRRTFDVPPDWQGQDQSQGRVLLHFQAVDWEATVYVNGRQVGAHRGGYDAFALDITDALRGDGPQELIVHVFDPTDAGDQPRGKQVKKPGGIFYTSSSGIWQTVWLEAAPAVRIERLVLVPDVDASCVRITVHGVGVAPRHLVQAVAQNGGREVARAFGGTGAEIKLTIPENERKLWSPADPFLYNLAVRLKDGERVVDEVGSYFGLRKIDIGEDSSGRARMRLNGETLFQIGPLDQGFWPDGLYTAPTDDALRYDIEATKRLGFNMTRKHVKVEPDRWYYWCDKLGLLVWQDMPSANNRSPQSRKQFEQELVCMVEGLRNHPSIVMWVVFNEGWGQHDTPRYVDLVRRLDPTRLVDNASGWADQKVGDVIDVHAYPGPAAPASESHRAGVLGEFGGLKLAVRGHTWSEKSWGYRETDSAQDLLNRYRQLAGAARALQASRGLSAAVYTQLTDVESECNGLLTYDRAQIKTDVEPLAAANRGEPEAK